MSGPSRTKFGDVVSSGLQYGLPVDPVLDLNKNYSLAIGQIVQTYSVDDPQNAAGRTAQFTTYDVEIFLPNGTTETIRRCRALQPVFGGGINNFCESLPTDPGADANSVSKSRDQRRGHMCLVGYVAGQKTSGVILGGMPHGNPVARTRRPKKGMAVCTEGEIQGLNFKVNNDGELTVTFNGPRNDAGAPTGSAGPTTIMLDKTGSVVVSTNADQQVLINRAAKTIKITNGETSATFDQASSTIQVAATQKIQLIAANVEVGSGALEPIVLGNKWKKVMTDLCEALSQLQVICASPGSPSGTPINASAFSAIKSQLASALSSKHKVEK